YAQWLAPRLAAFRAANPEVRLQLIADEDADFTEANLDFAVRLVEGPGDLEGDQLAPASRVLVTAPGGAEGWIEWPGFALPEGEAEHVVLQVGNAGQAMASVL